MIEEGDVDASKFKDDEFFDKVVLSRNQLEDPNQEED